MRAIKRTVKHLAWRYLFATIQDALAMQRIASLVADGPYVPWSGSALSATAVSTVLNDIVVNDRSTVIECGGGVSSLFIGSLLRQCGRPGAHLYTIEHDEDWIGVLHGMIRDHEIDDWVTLIHAPLCETHLSWDGERWYNTTVLESKLQNIEVDLLIVDGPPAHRPDIAYSRYPAGPFFEDVLGERCCVVMDDINREAERQIVEAWESELYISFQKRLLEGNIAIGTRGEAFNI